MAAVRARARGVGFRGLARGTRDGGLDRVAVAEDRHDAIGVDGLGLLWVGGHSGNIGRCGGVVRRPPKLRRTRKLRCREGVMTSLGSRV